jgi:hypothetical protein
MARLSRVASASAVLGLASAAVGPAAAHVGTLEELTADAPIPQWYVVAVAGVVVGGSFLFTSMMADHDALRWVNGLSIRARLPPAGVEALSRLIGVASVLALLGVILIGFVGPAEANANLASLGIWVAWWGGFTILSYSVGNAWPAIDPFRRLARLVPTRPRWDYPEDLGAWPAVVGLLVLVFAEVVSGSTERPRVLASLVLGYAVLTVLGAAAVGAREWVDKVDPLAAVFRTYGSLAPIQRTDDGLSVRLPGAALTDGRVYETPGRVAFVVALLWATTFDGLVSTPQWRTVIAPVGDLGVPVPLSSALVLLVYVVALVGGFLAFYGVYVRAARACRRSADTFVTAEAIARWLAPSLVPIAAGYHVAHFLGYVLSLSPALLAALADPLGTGPAGAGLEVAVLPAWFGFLQLGFVLVGHLLAVWVAHSVAFDLFPGARQPIRSQYPLILVMIAYTLVSAWVIVSPTVPTPYV